jgi:hypothetical protein
LFLATDNLAHRRRAHHQRGLPAVLGAHGVSAGRYTCAAMLGQGHQSEGRCSWHTRAACVWRQGLGRSAPSAACWLPSTRTQAAPERQNVALHGPAWRNRTHACTHAGAGGGGGRQGMVPAPQASWPCSMCVHVARSGSCRGAHPAPRRQPSSVVRVRWLPGRGAYTSAPH